MQEANDTDKRQENMKDVGQEKHLNVDDCLQILDHVSICMNPRCDLQGCSKMKRMLSHTKECKKKMQSTCTLCKHFLHLCMIHSKNCRATPCRIYLCGLIKRRVAQRQRSTKHEANARVTMPTQKAHAQERNSLRGANRISYLSNTLIVNEKAAAFRRTLSLQIPTNRNPTWLPFNRTESLEAMQGSVPELIGAMNGLIRPAEGVMERPLIVGREQFQTHEEMDS